MTKCPDDVIQCIDEYLDGEIIPDQERLLEDHLKECMECQQLFNELAVAISLLEQSEPVQAPTDFVEGVMAKLPTLPKQKKKSNVNRWLHKHPMLSAAALFLILMSAALFSSYNTNEQFSVTMQPNLIVEGETVVVPAGEVIKGDLVVKNGDLRIEGQVDGDVTVIHGEKYMASSAVVTGNIEEIDEIFDWIWYKMKTAFKTVMPKPSEE